MGTRISDCVQSSVAVCSWQLHLFCSSQNGALGTPLSLMIWFSFCFLSDTQYEQDFSSWTAGIENIRLICMVCGASLSTCPHSGGLILYILYNCTDQMLRESSITFSQHHGSVTVMLWHCGALGPRLWESLLLMYRTFQVFSWLKRRIMSRELVINKLSVSHLSHCILMK